MIYACNLVDLRSSSADLPPTDHTGRAKLFVDQLNRGDFAKAVEPFDAKMQEVMPADKLKQTWEIAQQAIRRIQGSRRHAHGNAAANTKWSSSRARSRK